MAYSLSRPPTNQEINNDLGACFLQPLNHLAEAALDFRVHQIQELSRRDGRRVDYRSSSAIRLEVSQRLPPIFWICE